MIVRGAAALALAFARGWTHAYTYGVEPAAREERRREIESDLWESLEDARRHGIRRRSAALEIAQRVVLGMADDLLWRVAEAPRPARRPVFWWAATALAVGTLTAVVMILMAAAPGKLPQPPAPRLAVVRLPPPPPPPPPPPTPADLR